MLMTLLGIKELPKLLDATDALAVAMCHHFQGGEVKAKSTSWESFLKENPARVKKKTNQTTRCIARPIAVVKNRL